MTCWTHRRLSPGWGLVFEGLDVQIAPTTPADIYTGELGYDRLNRTRKIGPSYAKSVVYIWQILDVYRTGTKHIVRHMQKSVVQWSVISKFTCISFWKHLLQVPLHSQCSSQTFALHAQMNNGYVCTGSKYKHIPVAGAVHSTTTTQYLDTITCKQIHAKQKYTSKCKETSA